MGKKVKRQINGFLTMINLSQVFEKNRFLLQWNRATVSPMSEHEKQTCRQIMTLLACAIVLATLAPVVVLAAS
jgi:hypothetical protein